MSVAVLARASTAVLPDASGPTPTSAPTSARGGKFLTFQLADEEYGVEILKVQEIMGMQPVTRVPCTPAAIRGVINLRGKVIPILDLRERFGMPSADAAVEGASPADVAAAEALRCIIVVQVALDGRTPGATGPTLPMGLVVDRVNEVSAIADADVEDAPNFGPGVRTEYLLGLGKTRTGDGQGRVRLLLDIDRVLNASDLDDLLQLPPDTPAR